MRSIARALGVRQAPRAGALALLVALAVGVAPMAVSAAQAAAPISWTALAPSLTARGPLSLSCPSSNLCVAVDGEGRAFSSTDPTSPSPAWREADIDGTTPLTGVSCPTTSLCVAVDEAGNVLSSGTPGSADAGSWTKTTSPADTGQTITGISCPTVGLCVATDEAGQVLTSSQPTSTDPASWAAGTVGSGAPLAGVSCSSETLCVAVSQDGNVFASEQPATTSAGAWHAEKIDPVSPLVAVSCVAGDGAGACVAVDREGRAFASADPGAPDAQFPGVAGPTWSATTVSPSPLSAISCAVSGLCVALSESGQALASDQPTAPVPTWSLSQASSNGISPTGTSCLPDGFCIAIGAPGAPSPAGQVEVFTGSLPAPGAQTGAASAVTTTTATLTGTVNPMDTVLEQCYFGYGSTGSYGQTAACSTVPSPMDVAQPVTAAIGGLSPGATYHYRLLAANGPGTGVGQDATFTTTAAPPPPATTVKPAIKPSLVGVPAVGTTLICEPGLSEGQGVSFRYAWVRDSETIANANAQSYLVKPTDGGHHLQCRVSASDAAGSVTATSQFVSIPHQGVPGSVGESKVAKVRVAGRKVLFNATCSKQAPRGCTMVARLTVSETLRGNQIIALSASGAGAPAKSRAGAAQVREASSKSRAGAVQVRQVASGKSPTGATAVRHVEVVMGRARVHLATGKTRVVKVSLTPAGRSILSQWTHGKVSAKLTVFGTVVGVLEATLAEHKMVFPRGSKGSRGARQSGHPSGRAAAKSSRHPQTSSQSRRGGRRHGASQSHPGRKA